MKALAGQPRGHRRSSSGEQPIVLSSVTTPATVAPLKSTRLRFMPRWLRTILTASCFGIFFVGTSAIGLVAGLYYRMRRVAPEDRWAFTTRINRRLNLFAGLMRDFGLIAYWPPKLPAGFENRPFLLIANHPTLIDVVLLLSSLPQLTCVVKASWYRSFVMGPMLRRTEYLPGPGHDGDEDDAPVVLRMEEKLRRGVPVLVFPEGTRSLATSLRRFRRGAIEAAIRAGVPILPLFIAPDQALLMKGQPFYVVPKQTAAYRFEFFEPIETAGRDLDSRELTREIAARFEARFEKLVEERRAIDREADEKLGRR
jgi:1-acyl-sn-glycerol-3-phosphate acyltransferase